MTLADVLQQLHYGELSFLKLGEMKEPEEQKRALAHISLGLTDLYKRFWLKTGEVVLYIAKGVWDYSLTDNIGQLSPANPSLGTNINYISYDHILKIERVFNSKNEEQRLNDSYCEDSFHTITPTTLRIPFSYKEEFAFIEYRANHPKLDLAKEFEDLCSLELELPEALLEPLLLFVAYRAFNVLNTDQKQEAMAYRQQYEESCMRIKNLGYEITPNRTIEKLDANGWV